MIKDCTGRVAKVGDLVYYSAAMKGAAPFYSAKVEKITEKSVCWKNGAGYTRRGAGCFVIHDPSELGAANAWRSLDEALKNIDGVAGDIRGEVSRRLHENRCDSAWIHHAEFVRKLVELLEEYNDNC